MEQYISKAAVVAEIKRLIRDNELYLSEPKTDEIRFQKVGAYSALNDLLHFLDTLEMKEVDLEEEFDKCCENYIFDDECEVYTAKHFFKLGFKAKGG